MNILSFVAELLGGIITPLMLALTFLILLRSVNLLKILNPRSFLKSISDLPEETKTTPLRALCLALAGTLGVGNITGVSSALICGGPGAIFWMWIGAIVSISVKYAEVYLAVLFRKKKKDSYTGGAMYYIRDGLSGIIPSRSGKALAAFFAILCCLNSLITGNLIQSNSAASVVNDKGRFWCGIFLASLVLFSIIYGTHRIEKITSSIIPILCSVYIIISLFIIIRNLDIIPSVFGDIFKSAFSFKSIGGGAVGFGTREAIRFGVMRGIFSNEAGSGTSPTAHASADTTGPHNQGCFGIIEVIFDTLILCTMTALVLMIADKKYGIIPWMTDADNAVVSLDAYGALTSPFVYYVLMISVVLFAYATIIAQIYYGYVAIGYLTNRKLPQYIYCALSVCTTAVGSIISPGIMWTLADIVIGSMTVINCTVVILLRKKIRSSQR